MIVHRLGSQAGEGYDVEVGPAEDQGVGPVAADVHDDDRGVLAAIAQLPGRQRSQEVRECGERADAADQPLEAPGGLVSGIGGLSLEGGRGPGGRRRRLVAEGRPVDGEVAGQFRRARVCTRRRPRRGPGSRRAGARGRRGRPRAPARRRPGRSRRARARRMSRSSLSQLWNDSSGSGASSTGMVILMSTGPSPPTVRSMRRHRRTREISWSRHRRCCSPASVEPPPLDVRRRRYKGNATRTSRGGSSVRNLGRREPSHVTRVRVMNAAQK